MWAETQFREIEARYMHETTILYEKHRNETETDLKMIDERMKTITIEIQKKHMEYYKNGHYRQANSQLDKRRSRLKERKSKDQRKMGRCLDKALAAAEEDNTHLRQSLQEGEQKESELIQELSVQRTTATERAEKSRRLTEVILKEKHEMYLKHAELELKCEQAEQKRAELQQMEDRAVQHVQQKGDLKVLVLEKQMKALTETLEKEQLKLWVALTFRQGDQTAAKHITELLQSKQKALTALMEGASGELKEYDQWLERVTAVDPSVGQDFSGWLCEMEKSLRKDSDKIKKADVFMQDLKAMCVPEDNFKHK
ncbi:uncharacterized protein LOC115044154 [Echeneis naucrates]|uniref:uncharacterized protein LOC115044154 n=1 Tax=Echeneis naucrates TaxID=173247 RepID=UPI0011142425|nr:uncharacterized protein LOC115044154 [Echeneis naucrates]